MTEPLDLLDPIHYETVRRPAAEAAPLPNWCYINKLVRARSRTDFHEGLRNYVGHTSQLPKAGDFFTLEVAGAPIIVITGDDGEVRTFHNSCRHRGSKIAWGEGNCKALTCPYHTWTYARDGALIATPLIEKDAHICYEDLGLLKVRLERWHGFLFVNFDDNAPPLASGSATYQRHVHRIARKRWSVHAVRFTGRKGGGNCISRISTTRCTFLSSMAAP